jgi:hypothetical protein
MEFLHGRPLSPEELDIIRQQLEGMDDVTAILRFAALWCGAGRIRPARR